VKFQGGVVGQHGVAGQLGRHQVGVHRICVGIGSRREDSEQPPPHPQQMSRPGVVGQEGLLGPGSRVTVGGEVGR